MRKSVLALALALVTSLDALLAGSVSAAPSLDTQASISSVSSAAIVQTALRYLGYPYTTVGNSPSTGFSCIGFVSYVYQVNGIPLPDDLGGAINYAPTVAFSDLMPGDVLFFQNTVWPGLSHTAIYLGGGRFVHAEWYNRGVVISSFTNDPVDGDYWMGKYLGANRPWSAVSVAPASPISVAPAPASSTPGSPPSPTLLEGPHARVQVAGLNVRIRPSLFAPVRRLATGGTTVVVLKQYRTWDWVQLSDGSFGWVAGTGIGDGSTPRSGGRLAGQALSLTRVQVNGLRVHTRPNIAAPVLASAFRGQRLLVLKRWNGWFRVLMADGTRGWVRGGYPFVGVVGSGDGHRAGPTAPGRHAGPTINAAVRLRSRPGLRAPILGLAAAGTHIRVLASWGKWVYVRFPSGRTGWVYRAYVRR